MGITSLVENRDGYSDKGLATALGGLTDGVSVMDMAVAYNTIYTGEYRRPKFYTKVFDRDGNEILNTSNLIRYDAEEILKPTTSAYLMDCLAEVIQTGTATGLKKAKTIIAGKTGTTNDEYDLWFVGNTKNYTVAVWYGYDQPKTIKTGDKHLYLYQKVIDGLVDLGREEANALLELRVDYTTYSKLRNKALFVAPEKTKEEMDKLTEEPEKEQDPVEEPEEEPEEPITPEEEPEKPIQDILPEPEIPQLPETEQDEEEPEPYNPKPIEPYEPEDEELPPSFGINAPIIDFETLQPDDN
jgi:membrane peptidoglycan carboxypeptidase